MPSSLLEGQRLCLRRRCLGWGYKLTEYIVDMFRSDKSDNEGREKKFEL
jgi:hypothetical protein